MKIEVCIHKLSIYTSLINYLYYSLSRVNYAQTAVNRHNSLILLFFKIILLGHKRYGFEIVVNMERKEFIC